VNDDRDPADKSSRKADDDASCPLCGHEDIFEPCAHLVADWSSEPGDDGVLGEGFTDNAAFAGARELAIAIRDLHNLVRDDEDESGSRLEELRRMMARGEQPPSWWPELDDHFENNDGLGSNGDSVALAYDADPVVEAIVQQVPDVMQTWVEMGAPMMNSTVYCLWAEDRAVATARLQERISAETENVRALIIKLKASLD
jgi:hypothetical protein